MPPVENVREGLTKRGAALLRRQALTDCVACEAMGREIQASELETSQMDVCLFIPSRRKGRRHPGAARTGHITCGPMVISVHNCPASGDSEEPDSLCSLLKANRNSFYATLTFNRKPFRFSSLAAPRHQIDLGKRCP